MLPKSPTGLRVRVETGSGSGRPEPVTRVDPNPRVALFPRKSRSRPQIPADSRTQQIPQILAQKADPVLLEPIMSIEIVTPEEYMGDVVGDLSRRRGVVHGMEEGPSGKIVSGEVPLAEMFGYATDIRSASQGRATFTMEPLKYSEVPSNVAEAIISKND